MAVVVLGLVAIVLGGCGSGHIERKAASACHSKVRYDALPTWARAGFTNPTAPVRHVLGASRDIVAILFGYPLLSPPSTGHRNKILWVSRLDTTPGSDLHIVAQRMAAARPSGSPVKGTVMGGPGPSIINLPSPGCWRLALRWSGHVDHVDVQYG